MEFNDVYFTGGPLSFVYQIKPINKIKKVMFNLVFRRTTPATFTELAQVFQEDEGKKSQ